MSRTKTGSRPAIRSAPSASSPVGFGAQKVCSASQRSCHRASISLARRASYRWRGMSSVIVGERTGRSPDRLLLWPLPYGAVAQAVEHFHGMEGVRGSNPLSSTGRRRNHECVRLPGSWPGAVSTEIESAVEYDDLSGDVAVLDQSPREVGDIIRSRRSAHRRLRLPEFPNRGPLGSERGVHEAGGDRVDAHLGRQCHREQPRARD